MSLNNNILFPIIWDPNYIIKNIKESQMKKSLLLILALFLFFLGCQENNSILEPTNQNQSISLNKLDAGSTFASDSYLINGIDGGIIKVTHSWKYSNGKKSKLKAVLEIPKNAFAGEKVFSMVFNLDKNSVSMYPSPTTFDKPLKFSYKLKNVNVAYNDLDFKYLDGNEIVEYDENIVDSYNGNLEVKKAKLHHFSDWGWDR